MVAEGEGHGVNAKRAEAAGVVPFVSAVEGLVPAADQVDERDLRAQPGLGMHGAGF